MRSVAPPHGRPLPLVQVGFEQEVGQPQTCDAVKPVKALNYRATPTVFTELPRLRHLGPGAPRERDTCEARLRDSLIRA